MEEPYPHSFTMSSAALPHNRSQRLRHSLWHSCLQPHVANEPALSQVPQKVSSMTAAGHGLRSHRMVQPVIDWAVIQTLRRACDSVASHSQGNDGSSLNNQKPVQCPLTDGLNVPPNDLAEPGAFLTIRHHWPQYPLVMTKMSTQTLDMHTNLKCTHMYVSTLINVSMKTSPPPRENESTHPDSVMV